MLTGRSSLLQVHQLYLREIKTKEHLHWLHITQSHNYQRKMYYVSCLINNLTI